MKPSVALAVSLFQFAAMAVAAAGSLDKEFSSPPDSARPGVYWYFLDGNQDRDAMVDDLHAMKEVGIGSVLFLEVDLGIPRGPVPFMSEPWQDNVAHGFVEAGKLGLEVTLGTGPGWAGSGGSWVDAGDSMQHLVGAAVNARGPRVFDQQLPVPAPHPANAFAGMSPPLAAERDKWFRDVAVIAYPAVAGEVATIGRANDVLLNLKTLKDVPPYSIRRTPHRYVPPQIDFPEPGVSQVLDPSRVVDLTSRLQPDGRLHWDMPEGNWTILRFVARATGQTTRPAPRSGHGFECNKFDAGSYRRHWDNYQKKLIDRVVREGGPLQQGRGLTTIHLDSWEMSSQNWTAEFRDEFRKRRGYDPQPFYPAWMGMVVGSLERTERFLWDMRKVSQQLVIENHAGAIKQLAGEYGLLYSNEPYDMNPAGDIDLGSVADIPMCEFWSDSLNTQYSCIEAVSIARTMGRPIVKAEAFTGRPPFNEHPAKMKNQTDWALAMGINGFMFHTYQHQPLGPDALPGMTFGPYGIHWNRNQTFWKFLPAYHEYLARCSHVLRQGEAVSDILYLTPEGAPHIFEAPADAFEGEPTLRDKRGYSFDAVTPRILSMRAKVENGRIAFPGGSSYRVLVLPDVPTMTPETLVNIDALVKAGATVVGKPPIKSPSLVNHPACDQQVSSLAREMWGGVQPPAAVQRVERGKGALYWGGDLKATTDLYPGYATTAALLADLGVAEDFSSPSGKLRYLHRRTAELDIYFVANRTAETVITEGVFRMAGSPPQLWDPLSGKIRVVSADKSSDGLTRVPLTFEPYQSFFVVFSHDSARRNPSAAPAKLRELTLLDGAWEVAFTPAMGGPESVTFDSLVDWTTRPEEGIRYYSGTATYRKSFDAPNANREVWLDLGRVHDIARVRLNGTDLGIVWTAPWRVDVTRTLRSAGNQIEIEVANTWANRLIGDQQQEHKDARKLSWPSGLLGGRVQAAGRYTFCTQRYHKPDAPLLPAGLLGPVRLLATED